MSGGAVLSQAVPGGVYHDGSASGGVGAGVLDGGVDCVSVWEKTGAEQGAEGAV